MADTIKIVLSGYYGFDNIGDEAVLYSIITALREELKNVHITVLSNNPEQTKALYNVDSINRWKIVEVIKVIKGSDLLISGGGSLLQDVTSSKTIPYYLAIVKIAQLCKKKVVFYSQGIGPVNKGISKALIKKVVNKVDGIFVRDRGSKQLLEEIGIQKPIALAIDPVLGVHPPQKAVAPYKEVGIYIRPWEDKEHDQNLIESMKDKLADLLSQGYRLCFIPMHYHQDREIAKELAEAVKQTALEKRIATSKQVQENIEVVDKNLSIQEVLDYTEGFEFIIGMRLHSLIMAAACQVPMLAISYDPKVEGFMKEINQPYWIKSKELTAPCFKEQVEKLQTEYHDRKKQLIQSLEDKKERIYLPVQYIKEAINKR